MPKLNQRLHLVVFAAAVIGIVVVALFTYQPKQSQNQECEHYRQDKSVIINSVKIDAELVESVEERDKGLSGRPCIKSNQGMLFVFDKPGQYPFWMKNMQFPIDIVWIDETKKVIGLDVGVEPSTYPDMFVSEKPAQYVLELQANSSKDLKIQLGTQVDF